MQRTNIQVVAYSGVVGWDGSRAGRSRTSTVFGIVIQISAVSRVEYSIGDIALDFIQYHFMGEIQGLKTGLLLRFYMIHSWKNRMRSPGIFHCNSQM
jgi:hypothetical protein